MKSKVIFITAFLLLSAVLTISAQQTKTMNFSGNWTLDAAKSKLNENLSIESMTMTVLQTGKNIKVVTKTTFSPPSESGAAKNRAGKMSGAGTIETNYTYTLDGKETEYKTADGIDNALLKAEIEKSGRLKLTQTRRFNMQMGETTLKIIEIWTLSADGKTLTVKRDADKVSGDFISKKVVTDSTEMVFVKSK